MNIGFPQSENYLQEKKYLLRELIGTGKKIYYIEETEIAGIEFLTEKEKEGLKKPRKRKRKSN